jgi:hypothetical protein
MGTVSARQLAEVIHADKSVVYRWLRHERVPPLNSDYLEKIRQHLALDERITGRLRQAQIASLSRPPTALLKRRQTPRGARAAFTRFIEHTSAPWPRSPITRPRLATLDPPAASPRGRIAVLRAAIALLERAAAHTGPRTGPILLSVQGKGLFERLPDASDTQHAWQEALHHALECG